MASSCEAIGFGYQAAFDGRGDEEGQDSFGMGQTRAPTAVVQAVKDGREVLAERALAGQFLEEGAGHGWGLVLGDGFLLVVAVFVGEGTEAAYPQFRGELAQEGIHLAAELGEGHGIILP